MSGNPQANHKEILKTGNFFTIVCTKDCDGELSRGGWRAEMWKERHHPSPQVCFFFLFFFFHTSASEGHSFFSLLFLLLWTKIVPNFDKFLSKLLLV
jgi:hypothetical protein